MAQVIQMRRGTAAEWTAANPLLAAGETGVELDTHKWKVGDGVALWNALPYATDPTADATTTTKGVIQLAGDLAGTAASPQIAAACITGNELANGAVNLNSGKVTGVLSTGFGGTGAGNNPTARNNLEAAGYYSSAVHGAGTTITITQPTHTLRATRGLLVQVQDEATGNVELPDISIAANGTVTVTFAAAVAANSKRVTVIG